MPTPKQIGGVFNFPAPAADAFGRLRVSNPETIFDSKQVYDEEPLLFDTLLDGEGSANYENAFARTRLSIAATASSRALRQTRRYFHYQPGKSQQIFITFAAPGGQEAGVSKKIGYFDDNDGFYLNISGETIEMVRRSSTSGSPVGTAVEQGSWSEDTLDGNGPSGITLDFTKSQILLIDFEWLGTGTARMGFVIGGLVYWAHYFNNANIADTVYMQTPNLPVRWEIAQEGLNAGDEVLDAICCSVASEGGFNPIGKTLSASRVVDARTVTNSTELWPVIGIRLKDSHKRATVLPIDISVISTTNSDFYWALILFQETTLDGVWTGVTGSSVEYQVGTPSVVTGGTVLASGYGSDKTNMASSTLNPSLLLGASVDGTVRDELVLVVQRLGESSEDFLGSITWKELT